MAPPFMLQMLQPSNQVVQSLGILSFWASLNLLHAYFKLRQHVGFFLKASFMFASLHMSSETVALQSLSVPSALGM